MLEQRVPARLLAPENHSMRNRYSFILLLSLAASPAFGQHGDVSLVGHAPQKAAGPARAPQPAAAPVEPPLSPGYFAAPPQTGTVAGGTNSYGLDGFALHFPALTLKLPTLQLPSLFSMRTNPRMLLDPGQAPYVQNSPMAYGASAIPMQALQQQQRPQQTPEDQQRSPKEDYYPTQKYDSASLEVERMLSERERQLAMLDQRVASLANSVQMIARLSEQAAARESETESFETPPPAVRWVEPAEASEARDRTEAPRQEYSDDSSRRRFATPDEMSSALRRLPPTYVQPVRFVSVSRPEKIGRETALAAQAPRQESRMDWEPPPRFSPSPISDRKVDDARSAGSQWWYVVAALAAGLLIGGTLMRFRQATIVVLGSPALLGNRMAGYIPNQSIPGTARATK